MSLLFKVPLLSRWTTSGFAPGHVGLALLFAIVDMALFLEIRCWGRELTEQELMETDLYVSFGL